MIWEKLKEYLFLIVLWLLAISLLAIVVLYLLIDFNYWSTYSQLFTSIIS